MVIDFPDRVIGTPSETELQRINRRCRDRLHTLWDVFADQFVPATGPAFLAGEAPGALDLLTTVVSRWSGTGTRAHLTTARPALSDLFGRVAAHDKLAPVFQKHWPAP